MNISWCRRLFLSLQAVCVALVSCPLLAQMPARTLIRTGHLLDVTTGSEPASQTIIVIGDKIAAITPTVSTPAQHVKFVMKSRVVHKQEIAEP